ncbi:MAG: 3'-5' exoribonuclease YhaM [Patescibacteria group bacterium]
MKNLFTIDYKDGDKVCDQFVLKRKELRNAKTGSIFLSLSFSDREGEISAKKWDTTQDEFDNLIEGKVYEVIGDCDSYQGKIQLVVRSINEVPENEIRVGDFLPTSKFSFEVLKSKILKVINSIKDEDYSKILKFIFDDESLEKFCKFPAGKEYHHATIGGLAEHVLSLVESGEFYAKKYELDRDLLISGILMHDFAKIFEYKIGTSFEFTNIGKLAGHISIGFAKILEAGKSTLADEIKTFLLGHLVLSHHEMKEFGSPVEPSILEAFALSAIDDLDYKIDMIKNHKPSKTSDGWTDWVRALNRKIYFGQSESILVSQSKHESQEKILRQDQDDNFEQKTQDDISQNENTDRHPELVSGSSSNSSKDDKKPENSSGFSLFDV